MNAYKTYSTLELTEVMPLFPFDFIQAVLFSLIPPLWWAVADPLVDAQLANTKPSKEHLRKVKQIIGAYTATTTIVLVVWAASS